MKKRNLFALLSALLLLSISLLLSACGDETAPEESSATAESTETASEEPSTEPVEEPTKKTALYYNLYGKDYLVDDETTRTQDKDDGYIHMDMATGGRVTTVRVKDKVLANRIDHMTLLVPVFDDNHIVVDVQDASEFAGGYLLYNATIMSIDEKKITANSSASGQGKELIFDLTSDVQAYNVSNYTTMLGGLESKFYATDKITLIAKEDGTPGWLFVTYREPGVDSNHVHCYCTETTKGLLKNHVCEEERYIPWNKEDSLPTEAGHYYLNCDVYTRQNGVEADATVVICLNGHKIQGELDRRIYVTFGEKSELIITDCRKEAGSMAVQGTPDQGGALWVRYGKISMFAGTVDASKGSTKDHNGVAIALEANTEFNLYGGTVIGGTAPKGRNGGAVFVQATSVFNMYGGILKDGKAPTASGGNVFLNPKATFNLYGGTVSGGQAQSAGNIFVSSEAVLNISGGTVTGGRAKSGGNLSVVKGGTIHMAGGYVSSGRATAELSNGNYSGGHGGNLSVSGTFKMTGGTITAGQTTEGGAGGGNLSVYTNDGVAVLAGGQITNGVSKTTGGNIQLFYAPNNGKGPLLTLSGTNVKGGKAGTRGGNLHISNTATVTQTSGVIEGGSSEENGGNVFVAKGTSYLMKGGEIKDGVAQKDAGNVRIDGVFTMEAGKITGGSANGSKENGTANIQMIRQDEKTALVMTGGEIAGYVNANRLTGAETTPFITLGGTAKIVGGKGIEYPSSANEYYFLVNPLSEGAQIQMKVPAGGSAPFAVSGSGFTDAMCDKIDFQSDEYRVVKKADQKLYALSKNVRLQCVCGCTNSATCTHHVGGHTCVMQEFQPYTASETVLPKSGYYYLTKDVTTSGSTGIEAGQTLALDLNGHTVTFKGRGFSFISADASSVLYLSDSVGTGKYLIKNGTPNQGNGIWLPKGSATMFGGVFDATGIVAEGYYGGVICLEGGNATFTMNGGTIIGMRAKRGGSVSVANTCTFTMNAGLISGGTCLENGGNVYEANGGKIYMNGGTVQNGAATGDGGNFRADGAFTMTGGLITGGMAGGSDAARESANFQSCGQSANTWFKMSGGEITGCVTMNRLAAPDTQAFVTISGSAKITGTGVGLNLASNVTAQTFHLGALTENALIRIRPQSVNPFATLSSDFTAAMADRFVSTDASKKAVAQDQDGVLSISFVTAE